MLHILFSRAMLLPWLGMGVMAAGAVFPEENVVGMVLIVIGANVAFYSLRDFSVNFAWGPQSRPMLNLCGLLFLLGLALLAGSLFVEALHPWLALLCAGLYLCLFAVWIIQQPVTWPWRILVVGGSLLMVLGSIAAHLGWPDWQVTAASQPVPQEITLLELQTRGFGTNRYLRLKDFRFCDGCAAEQPHKETRFNDLWIPVVAVDRQAVQKEGPAPSVPPRLRTVTAYVPLGGSGVGGRRPVDLLQKKREADGYECTVVTGIRKLKPEVKQQLTKLAPQTDFADLILLDWRKPSSAEWVYGSVGGGSAGFLVALFAVGLVYFHAQKVVGAAGWTPAAEASDVTSDSP